LKRLAKSLLLNFLELMGTLSTTPASAPEKISDLRTLFINFHHLLNEYRPHQARESLIMMMEEQLERSKQETRGIEGMKIKVEGILKGLGDAKLRDGEDKDTESEGAKAEDDLDTAAWDELEKQFGHV
jgi:mediator of RNA polymerase II transcription subunit 7